MSSGGSDFKCIVGRTSIAGISASKYTSHNCKTLLLTDKFSDMLNHICIGLRPLSSVIVAVPVRKLNANRCAVTKVKRSRYTRQYPTSAVLPDGSTITSKLTRSKECLWSIELLICSQISGSSAAGQVSNRNGKSFRRREEKGADCYI